MKEFIYPEKFDTILADRVNDGCGPGGWKNNLIPDVFLWADFKEACRIHDYDFFLGGNLADFEAANERFYQNMLIAIHNCQKAKLLNPVKRAMARLYRNKVIKYGKLFFNWA